MRITQASSRCCSANSLNAKLATKEHHSHSVFYLGIISIYCFTDPASLPQLCSQRTKSNVWCMCPLTFCCRRSSRFPACSIWSHKRDISAWRFSTWSAPCHHHAVEQDNCENMLMQLIRETAPNPTTERHVNRSRVAIADK